MGDGPSQTSRRDSGTKSQQILTAGTTHRRAKLLPQVSGVVYAIYHSSPALRLAHFTFPYQQNNKDTLICGQIMVRGGRCACV